MDAKMRLETVKGNLSKAEKAETIAKTQAQATEEQITEVTKKMAALGVTPETIGAERQQLAAKIDADLTKVENLVPKV